MSVQLVKDVLPTEKKILIHRIDLQGKMLAEDSPSPGLIIYMYSDGSIEKKIRLNKM